MRCGVFKSEIERNKNWYTFLFLLMLWFSLLLIVQMGINSLLMENKKIKDFQESEKYKISMYNFWQQYGTHGLNILLLPPNLSAIFSNSTSISTLNIKIDSGYQLEITKPEGPDYFFKKQAGAIIDFSFFFLIFGSFIVIPFGYYSFKNNSYLTFLKSFFNIKRIYYGILIARSFIILFFSLISGVTIIFLFQLNNIPLTFIEIRNLFFMIIVSFICIIISFLFSSICGLIKREYFGIIFPFILIFFINIILPELFTSYFLNNVHNSIENKYRNEIKKLNIIKDFDKKSISMAHNCQTNEDKLALNRNLAKYYLLNCFPKIQTLDNQLLQKIQYINNQYHKALIYSPFSFSRNFANEISGKGINAYCLFFKYAINQQQEFLQYYLNNYIKSNFSKVVPFPGNNTFTTISSFPLYVWSGVIINFVYIIILVFLGGILFSRKGELFKEYTPNEFFINGVPVYFYTKNNLLVKSILFYMPNSTHIFLPQPNCLPLSTTFLKKNLNIKTNGLSKWEVLFEFAVSTNKSIIAINFIDNLSLGNIQKIKTTIQKTKQRILIIGSDRYHASLFSPNYLFNKFDKSIDISYVSNSYDDIDNDIFIELSN